MQKPFSSPVSGAPDAPTGEIFAALDLGTNNCRLLVARADGAETTSGFTVIDAFSRIVRLGEGLAASGVLSEGAMTRTIDALKICAERIASHRVSRARTIATEACRRAGNGPDFMARVRGETGLDLEIITPEEEARLVVAGCSALLDPHVPNALVFDIGGGSTELVWLSVPPSGGAVTIIDSVSLPHGVVTLADRYGGREVSPETYAAMVAEIDAALADVDARNNIAARVAAGAVQMLGSSGTVTTLAAVHFRLPRYNRRRVDGATLSFDDLRRASRLLSSQSHEQRVRNGCIGIERADLVIGGCAILEAICNRWPVGKLRIADRGIREGILLNLARGA